MLGTIAYDAGTRGIAVDDDIFDPETGCISIAHEANASVRAQDLSAFTAIVIVLTSDLGAHHVIDHAPGRAFVPHSTG